MAGRGENGGAKKIKSVVVSVVAVVVLWQAAVSLEWAGPPFLPSPLGVLRGFFAAFSEGGLLAHSGASLLRTLALFALGCAPGIFAGLCLGFSGIGGGFFDTVAAKVARPAKFLRAHGVWIFIPVICAGFFAPVWLGADSVLNLATVVPFIIAPCFVASLWMIMRAAHSGARGISFSEFRAAPSKLRALAKMLPPGIFAGMRGVMGCCWAVVIYGEVLLDPAAGIGVMITSAGKTLNTELVFIGIIAIGVIGASIDAGMRKLEARMILRKESA